MDAGLPSWPELIVKLERILLKEDLLPSFQRFAATDPKRRALQVQHMAERQLSLNRALNDALFPDAEKVAPGDLALAVARVVAQCPTDIEVVTTNFDNILETALKNEGYEAVPYSLTGYRDKDNVLHQTADEWASLSPELRRSAVMHLHGMVNPDGPPLNPLVLDESSFYAHGSAIQKVLVDRLKVCNVLLIGLSLTDPNVVVPLRDTREVAEAKHLQRFMFTVPDGLLYEPRGSLKHPPTPEALASADFASKNAEMTAKQLGVEPILLRSFGQQAQVVSEVALAMTLGSDYRDGLRYGRRFSQTLSDVYRGIGYSPSSGRPTRRQAAQDLSSELRKAWKTPRGPQWFLNQMRKKYYGRCAEDEKFAAFLWLREVSSGLPYHLRLVASSAYVHWEPWSAELVEPIGRDSRYTSCTAVYERRPKYSNIESRTRGNWRGSLGLPLTVYFEGSEERTQAGNPLDILPIGAFAVNTTAIVESEGCPPEDLSVLAVMDGGETQDLFDRLSIAAERIL